MPRFPLLGFSALLHAYVGWRLLPALAAWPAFDVALGVLLTLSAVLIPLAMRARAMRSRRLVEAVVWAGMLCAGLFSSLFVLTLVRDVMLMTVAIVNAVAPGLVPV